jgi:hypothetical protein
LRAGFCRSNVDTFEEQYRVSYTKLNCEFFANSGFQHDCSLSPYYGVITGTAHRQNKNKIVTQFSQAKNRIKMLGKSIKYKIE